MLHDPDPAHRFQIPLHDPPQTFANSPRELAKIEKDPLVIKLIRFIYEYLEENEAFDVEGQFEEDEEGNRFPVEGIEDKENLLYVLSLLQNAEQKINREELKDYRSADQPWQ